MIGATEEEIRQVESELGVDFPRCYRTYLLHRGRDYHGPLVGTDCYVDQVAKNTSFLPELLEENDVVHALPRACVCFFMHQGYIAAWFDAETEVDDPPCWVFSEAEDSEPKLCGTFTSFMRTEIEAFGGTWYDK